MGLQEGMGALLPPLASAFYQPKLARGLPGEERIPGSRVSDFYIGLQSLSALSF
jgi:hypothetical protein